MDKQALRSDVRARRRARSEAELAGWGVLLAAHVASIPGRTLTAFVGAGGEVPTLPLLDALVADGRRVLLPITLDDMQLDWAEYTGAADLAPAAFGLLEPTAGQLTVLGKSPREARTALGYVPQAMRFDPQFPIAALDIVLMGRLNHLKVGAFSKKCREVARAALAFYLSTL